MGFYGSTSVILYWILSSGENFLVIWLAVLLAKPRSSGMQSVLYPFYEKFMNTHVQDINQNGLAYLHVVSELKKVKVLRNAGANRTALYFIYFARLCVCVGGGGGEFRSSNMHFYCESILQVLILWMRTVL